MLPYTPEVLYAFLDGYNAALWPAQLLAYFLALAALWLAWRPTPSSGRTLSLLLAFAWGVCGGVFHLQHFQSINIFSQYFGPVFLLQALLLLWTGVIRGRLAFAARESGELGRAGVLILVALVAVPFLGGLAGHGWSPGAIVGLAPAPTLLFTLGLLLLCTGRTPRHLLLLPLVAAAIGGAEAWLLRLPWEGLPPLLALLGLAAILLRNRRIARSDRT